MKCQLSYHPVSLVTQIGAWETDTSVRDQSSRAEPSHLGMRAPISSTLQLLADSHVKHWMSTNGHIRVNRRKGCIASRRGDRFWFQIAQHG